MMEIWRFQTAGLFVWYFVLRICVIWRWRWQQSIPVSPAEKAVMVRKNPASIRYHLLRRVSSGSTHRDVFQRKLKLYLTLAVELGTTEESSRWCHFERHLKGTMESKQLRLSTERSGRPISDGAASAEAEAPGWRCHGEAEPVWQAIEALERFQKWCM